MSFQRPPPSPNHDDLDPQYEHLPFYQQPPTSGHAAGVIAVPTEINPLIVECDFATLPTRQTLFLAQTDMSFQAPPPSIQVATGHDVLTEEAPTSSSPTAETASSHPTHALSAPPQPNVFANNLSRDALLAYAYHLYGIAGQPLAGLTSLPLANPLPAQSVPEQVYKLQLLPLLITLRSLHPQDTAVLLLMACTYYALRDYDTSLAISLEMLKIDPNSVEAMSNIGTTMRAMGRNDQAYEWWWKAIQIRPTYWDAIENLFSMLLSAAQNTQDSEHSDILYRRILDVCTFVQEQSVEENGRIRSQVMIEDLHRLQKVYFTSATVRAMDDDTQQDAVRDYFRGIEVTLCQPPPSVHTDTYTIRELILATFVAGYLVQSATDGPVPAEVLESIGKPPGTSLGMILTSDFDIFRTVKLFGDQLLRALLRIGGNTLPFLLLLPDHVSRLPTLLFQMSGGVLPAICSTTPQGLGLERPSDSAVQQTNSMTSTLLLALAKRCQDLPVSDITIPGFQDTLNVNHSLAITFYYLALSLTPTPSTYNNMGIILSMTSSTSSYDIGATSVPLDGYTLARVYYNIGLQLEPSHPHLLTNLGSLYKDQGKLEEAIRLYLRAISVKPDFDIALANLGNAVKDTGRTWEAIEYYRRAVDLNPNLPEALCGLVNSMASVCDWRGWDALADDGFGVDSLGNVSSLGSPRTAAPGYMQRVKTICQSQLDAAYFQNVHCVRASHTIEGWINWLELAFGRPLRSQEQHHWRALIGLFYGRIDHVRQYVNEAGFVIRFLHWLHPRLQRQWYLKAYGKMLSADQDLTADSQPYSDLFLRPPFPRTMTPPIVPSILPFNTFTYPLPPRMVRLISHRNDLRISYTTLSQPWLPKHVYPPPSPAINGVLNIGYVSNDVNNHPLSHLMFSVFGFHDKQRFKIFLYTTSPWDGSVYRQKMSKDADVFVDASSWSTQQIVEHIVQHNIHILINLGGYTKGTRNDVFTTRPCPIQMQLMGYAGTLGAGWCDYLVCDPISCPEDLCANAYWRKRRARPSSSNTDVPLDLYASIDPEDLTDDWVFVEKFVYMPHTFMVTDHKQSYRTDENLSPEQRVLTPVTALWLDEETRRMQMRLQIFPDISYKTIVFANFNQLYKVDPSIYAVWLRILSRVPNSILWLLRFPVAAEEHLLRSAALWAGAEVASRVRFTDVAQKEAHIHRARVADLFLDTVECNAHTVTADVLWSGTPVLTFPKHRHKMCSRVATSMVHATGFGNQMVVHSLQEYEDRAVALAQSLVYTPSTDKDGTPIVRGQGELIDLRRNIFLNRDRMPLFDTVRWTRNIEKAYQEAWRRWVEGTQFEQSDEWEECTGPEKQSGSIWVKDEEPYDIVQYDDSQFT